MTSTQTCIGSIGGLGTLAGGDVHRKMLRRLARDAFPDQYRILYQHHHFDGAIGSRVYHEAAAGAEFELLMPDPPRQTL